MVVLEREGWGREIFSKGEGQASRPASDDVGARTATASTRSQSADGSRRGVFAADGRG